MRTRGLRVAFVTALLVLPVALAQSSSNAAFASRASASAVFALPIAAFAVPPASAASATPEFTGCSPDYVTFTPQQDAFTFSEPQDVGGCALVFQEVHLPLSVSGFSVTFAADRQVEAASAVAGAQTVPSLVQEVRVMNADQTVATSQVYRPDEASRPATEFALSFGLEQATDTFTIAWWFADESSFGTASPAPKLSRGDAFQARVTSPRTAITDVAVTPPTTRLVSSETFSESRLVTRESTVVVPPELLLAASQVALSIDIVGDAQLVAIREMGGAQLSPAERAISPVADGVRIHLSPEVVAAHGGGPFVVVTQQETPLATSTALLPLVWLFLALPGVLAFFTLRSLRHHHLATERGDAEVAP